jgi:hypothetical protein
MRLSALSLALTAITFVALAPVASAPAQPTCDPFLTPASYRGVTPKAEDVLGFPIGSQEVTSAESDRYVHEVAAASDRVVSGTFGRSVEGRPLTFAIVGQPENVTPEGLAAVQNAARTLMNPATPDATAEALAASTPAILWVSSNVHGGEESGTDASLRVLFELADRDDCAAREILDSAVVVLVPIQNPDGREAEARRNAFDFDMNRDWFARTQPEIDAMVELMKRYPPQLAIDDHEMGTRTFFFPPNADPVYHEVTDEVLGWINNIYGASMQAEFDRQRIPYFNYTTYDFFGVYYGDTVPANGFQAAGMTFEKHSGDPISVRTYEQYVAQWTSLFQAGLNKERILSEWHDAWVEALAQGRAGVLEPNGVVDPRNKIETQVPTDPVRHYFVRAGDPSKAAEVQSLIRRLQRMEVGVYRLTEPLAISDFREYGRRAASTTLPPGTYWIPLAQRQKHWIQAMMHETTHPPVNFFYDVSAWSQPLLSNVSAGFSGAILEPNATPVSLLAEPAPPVLPADVPSIAVLRTSASAAAIESAGWLRYLFEREWRVPYRPITGSQIAAGALAGVDVLIATEGHPIVAMQALGNAGRNVLRDWVNAGGTMIGFRGGAELAARLGISTAVLKQSHGDVPGSLLRVAVDPASPLAAGVGPFNWVLFDYDHMMTAQRGAVPARFPAFSSADFFVSGFAEGEHRLGGTAAVVDEPVGTGRAVVFSTDPNYRAWTKGAQKLLWNTIFGADPWPGTAAAAGSTERATAEANARKAAEGLPPPDVITISVHSRDAGATEQLIRRYTKQYTVTQAGGKVTFQLANPEGYASDEHPFATLLADDLLDAGIDVVAFRAP